MISTKYTNFKQLYPYIPKSTFRMLICGNSASSKTNPLYHILMKPLVYYDQIHLYDKNLQQEKYKHVIKELNDSNEVGYDIISHSKPDDCVWEKKNLLIISCKGEIKAAQFSILVTFFLILRRVSE